MKMKIVWMSWMSWNFVRFHEMLSQFSGKVLNYSSCSYICCVSSTYSFNPRTFAERNAEAIDVSRDQTKRQEKVLSITQWGQSFFEVLFKKYFTITVSTSSNFVTKKRFKNIWWELKTLVQFSKLVRKPSLFLKFKNAQKCRCSFRNDLALLSNKEPS